MGAIDSLLGMQSPSNMTNTSPYLAKRRGDIYSGLDDLVPDADSAGYREAQARGPFGPGGISREDYRDSDLAQIRQLIGMEQMKQQNIMQNQLMTRALDQQNRMAFESYENDRLDARTAMLEGGRNERADEMAALREFLAQLRGEQTMDAVGARNEGAMERTQVSQEGMDRRAGMREGGGLWSSIGNFLSGLVGGGGTDEEIGAEQDAVEAPVAPAPRRQPRIVGTR